MVFLLVVVFYSKLYSQITNSQLTNVISTNTQDIIPGTADEGHDAVFNRGLKELQKGNLSKAISLLEKLLSYNTANPDYYIYLGYLYYKQFNYDKAVDVLNRSLGFDDDLLVSHILLGEIYYQMNSILKARTEFEEVISINPKVKLAHIRLYELFKNNNPIKANEHYLQIFHLNKTKLEKFLPDIDKIGSITLRFNKNVLILKDSIINRKLQKDRLIEEILGDSSDRSDKEKIIVSVKNKKFKLNLNFGFLLNPFKKFDKEKFYIKIIELIFVSIFLFIYSFFQRKKEKRLERIVLNQYRVSTVRRK